MRPSGSLPALPARAKAPTEPPRNHEPAKQENRYAAQFSAQAKSALVQCDVSPLLARFEDAALFTRAHRKPLTVVLRELADDSRRRSSIHDKSAASPVVPTPIQDSVKPVETLQHRAPTIVLNRPRRRRRSPPPDADRPVVEQHVRSRSSPERRVPSRFLFDDSRWQRASRCDYCLLAGGDLECATCDVVAHAACYLAAYEATVHKSKVAFVVPTRFSWLCRHCQASLQDEYDTNAQHARAEQLMQQRTALAKAVTAYVRMRQDARLFAQKKLAIVKIQAIVRGRLARWRFLRLQRARLRPYVVDGLRLTARLTAESPPAGSEELRLANGFSCNPFVHVALVDGEDDSRPLFSFETAVRKTLVVTGGGDASVDVDWPDRVLIPGVDGNVTVVLTVLSKNGPNHFFLGQAVLRLVDAGPLWKDGGVVKLQLADRVDISPRTAQRQPLRIAQTGFDHIFAPVSSSNVAIPASAYRRRFTQAETVVEPVTLTAAVRLEPMRQAASHCGFLGLKATLDGFHASSRWCVLADGTLRIYRHYGVTAATETVDLGRAIDVRLAFGTRTDRKKRADGGPTCVVVELVTRTFVFEGERPEAARTWHKKLQTAMAARTGTTS